MADNDRASGRHRPGGALAATVVAAAVTLTMAAPVLVQPSERLFGVEIDGRHPDPFYAIVRFETPRAPDLYTQAATDYPGALLTWISGNGVVAYNLLVLASFPLAALFTWLLAARLTGSRLAAWVAALAYAFAPFHLAHAAYHPHTAQTQWLPLYLLALWLALERGGSGRLALLAAAAALVSLSSFYYGLIAAAITPVALAGFWLAQRRRRMDPAAGRHLRWTVLVLAAVAVLGVLWIVRLAPAVTRDPGRLGFPAADLSRYTARPASYLVPPLGHPLLGGLARDHWRSWSGDGLAEQQVTVGAGLLSLALAALLLPGRRRRDGTAPALAVLALFAAVLSLPPALRLGSVELPMPSSALHALLPIFRAHARFGLVVFLAVAILAGVGAARLWRAGGRRRLAALALLVLAAIELTPLPPWRWRDVLPTAAHRWLAELPREFDALDCIPYGRRAAEATAVRFFDGRLRFPEASDDCGDPGAAERLAADGVSYLIIRRDSPLWEWLARRPLPPGLELLARFDDAMVLTVAAAPAAVDLRFGHGFSWRQYKGSDTYRWMAATGGLELRNRLTTPLVVTLELQLHAFPEARQVTLELDGMAVARLAVGTSPAWHGLGPLRLTPGRHRLTLRSLGPAVIADEVLGNGDRRELAVALWDWRMTTAGAARSLPPLLPAAPPRPGFRR